ncbi:MAG TPA: PfkB family carbohydrate kinase [Patescibacteria group bacterium]|nr:PfkB family carbohydrate kinase [Patescibacteria group bacterium]
MSAFEVITIGDATVDIFLTLLDANKELHLNESHELCVKFGEKVDVDRADLSVGGNAANVAVGLARLGVKAALAAELGDEGLSSVILDGLAKENIDQSLIVHSHSQASISVGLSYQKDRTLFVDHVVRQHKFSFDKMKNANLIFLTSIGREWESVYKSVLALVENSKIQLAFNPGSLQLHEGRELVLDVLKKTHLLFVNKEEAEQLLFNQEAENSSNEEKYIEDLEKKLRQLGPKIVIITNGSYGSYLMDEEGLFYSHPASEAKVVEKTGAGDAYTSGFLAAWCLNRSIDEAMDWGTQNAVSVIGKIGAQAGLLTPEEMMSKLASLKLTEENMSAQIPNSNLYILAFDHRNTFAEHLFNVGFNDLSSEQKELIKDFKNVIYDGFKQAISFGIPKNEAGLLVDEEFGDAVLQDGIKDGYVTILTLEKSGEKKLEFEYGDQFTQHIQKYKPKFVKILAHYNPDDPEDFKQQQITKMREVSKYAHENGYKFLLEVLVEGTEKQLLSVENSIDRFDGELRPELTIRLMKELQAAGVEPDIWKLEGMDAEDAYAKCVHQARMDGRNAGIVVLGRGENSEKVEQWLRVGAKVDGVIGFAVGRTIFWDAIVSYYKKTFSREETVKKIAENYLHYYQVFKGEN